MGEVVRSVLVSSFYNLERTYFPKYGIFRSV